MSLPESGESGSPVAVPHILKKKEYHEKEKFRDLKKKIQREVLSEKE
jgi:hypothetical protein